MAEPVMAEPMLEDALITGTNVPEQPVAEPETAQPVPEQDNASLAPPEATEEPDLNTPPAAVIEDAVEQEQQQHEARPSPPNSAREASEGAD
jgi:hypothetical protein